MVRNQMVRFIFVAHTSRKPMGLIKKFSRHRADQPNLGYGQRVRAGLGLTQAQLALLLGVSREVLAADEAGRRYLMGPAGRLLSELGGIVRELPAEEASTPAPAPELPEAESKPLRLRLMGIKLRNTACGSSWPAAKRIWPRRRRRQQALPALQKALPADNAYAAIGLVQLTEEAALTLRYEGPREQLLLLRLRVLAFEASETEKLVGPTPA